MSDVTAKMAERWVWMQLGDAVGAGNMNRGFMPIAVRLRRCVDEKKTWQAMTRSLFDWPV